MRSRPAWQRSARRWRWEQRRWRQPPSGRNGGSGTERHGADPVGKTKTLLATKTVQTKRRLDHPRWRADRQVLGDERPGRAQRRDRTANWKGTWSSSYHEYFITGILGDNETSKKYYWGLYVNGKLASKGACDVKLKSGDKLLFKVTKS